MSWKICSGAYTGCPLSGCPVRWEKHRACCHQKESALKGNFLTSAKPPVSHLVLSFEFKSHFCFSQILESKEIEALVAEIEKEKEEEAEKKKQKKTT